MERGEARETCVVEVGVGRRQGWVHDHMSLDKRLEQ